MNNHQQALVELRLRFYHLQQRCDAMSHTLRALQAKVAQADAEDTQLAGTAIALRAMTIREAAPTDAGRGA